MEDSGVVMEHCDKCSDNLTDDDKSLEFYSPPGWANHLWSTKIPIAAWRLAELEFLSTKIPIAKWRLREFYMEKKNKIYRGTATSFGFKKPTVTSNNVKPAPQSNNHAPSLEHIPSSVETSAVSAARTNASRLARPMKEMNAPNYKANRFGFKAPVLSNKIADLPNNTKTNQKSAPEETPVTKQVQTPRSHLPRMQQFPVRLVAPAHYHPRTASVDKSTKTAANNHTARRSRSENGGSSASSVNDADSGVGSQKSGGELEMIEQLDCSPSARNKLRHPQRRPMEMILSTGHDKKFELRDHSDRIELIEIKPLDLPSLPLNKLSIGSVRSYMQHPSRDSSEDDEGIEDEPGEEKVHRDRVLSEKDEKGVVGAGEEPAEADDLWGHGEAMAGEEDLSGGPDTDYDPGSKVVTPPLRSVLLSIEDHSFAALAAMSTSVMLEDESCPELQDFQNSLSLTCTSAATSPNNSPPHQSEKKNSESSPGTPGTPTHTSNSLSFSSDNKDRDFIDDELIDQPDLVFDNVTANSSGNTVVPDEPSPKCIKPLNSVVANLTVDCGSGRHSSVGTLSPCESIASDDLIMDFDLSAVDDDHRYFYRLDTSSLDLGLTDGEAEEDREKALQELSSLIAARPEVGRH